jgi:hypothetical protein
MFPQIKDKLSVLAANKLNVFRRFDFMIFTIPIEE